MLKFEIIHCPLTDVLLFDLFLTTQLFCFPCHCYYQAGDLLTSDCCSLHQAGACCRCFPSLTGTVTREGHIVAVQVGPVEHGLVGEVGVEGVVELVGEASDVLVETVLDNHC